MEIAKVKVTGTRAETIEALDIPEGIVGATVSFEFGPEWAGLTKNVVFVGAKDVEILNIQDSVYLPPEAVSAPNIIVKVGIVGVDANKKMVIPTLWADLGTVKPGAPVGMGYEPTLPIWAQLMGMIGDLRGLNTADKSNLVAAINEAMSKSGTAGGYYTPVVTQPTTNTMKIAFVPSVATMPAVEPVTITLPGSDSGQNAKSWTAEQINLLDQLFNYIPWTSAGAGTIADALIASLRSGDTGGEEEPDVPVTPEKTLNSISAVYSGGDVAVGTAVTDLTGIVVTAHYSDGTSETVTGYTLSGTIAEGSNTITVSYGGKTATFTVNGVAEIGGNEVSVNTWNTGYFDSSGNVIADSRYMCCEEYLPVSAGDTCYFYNSNRAFKNTESRVYWYTYDEEKKYLKEQCGSQYSDNRRFATSSKMMPDGAAFVRVSSAPTVEEYKDTAFMSTKMPEPVLTLADAEWYEGYILGDTGGVRLEEGCWYSDLISVEAGAKYRFANSDSSWSEAWVGIGFYEDITEKFISRANSAEFTVPDGAKYLRLSAQNMTGYCETATLEKIS